MKFSLDNKNIEANRGITLIALIVTIIVLLILAGITVATLTGDNGLISKTGEAKDVTERSNEKEELEIEILGLYDKRGRLDVNQVIQKLRENIKNLDTVVATDEKFPVRVTYKNRHKYIITNDGEVMILIEAGEAAPSYSNALYVSDGKIAIIPGGYTVSSEATEQSIDNGLVIKKGENEWVWIPVEDSSVMYSEANTNTDWKLNGTNVVTKYKSNSSIIQGITRDNPDTNNYREPGILYDTSFDNNQENLESAGFISYEKMAEGLRDDYKEMIESVKQNKGFYVGRYELSEAGTQKNQEPITDISWYKLYKKCKEIDSNGVETRMIWGCQWDQICNFISTSGDKVILTDSRTYGNYLDSDENAKVIVDGVNKYGKKQVTGYSDYWKTNNIYDLAGNCWEWTQEAKDQNIRAVRGGSGNTDGASYQVTYRTIASPNNIYSNRSSRAVLYVK